MEFKEEIYQKTYIVQSFERKLTKANKQESIVWYKGPQDDDFLEKILLHSGCFEAVGKLPGNDNWLVRQHNSEVLIMFDCRDNEKGCILKKDREKFQAELDQNKYECAVLVSLNANVDPKGESFVIKTSRKGKPFLYINNLRSCAQPEIICKIASLVLIHAVENKPTDQNKAVRKFLTSQFSTLKDLLQNSQKLRKLADQNEIHVKGICHAFEDLLSEEVEKDPMFMKVLEKQITRTSENVSTEREGDKTENGMDEEKEYKPSMSNAEAWKISSSNLSIKLLNINTNGLNGSDKRALFHTLIESTYEQPHIICGVESKLSSIRSNAEIFPANYIVFRKDREDLIPVHGLGQNEVEAKEHGGVFIAVRNDVMCTKRPEFDSNCEIVWAQLRLPGDKALFIAAHYRHHPITAGLAEYQLDELRSSLNKVFKNQNFPPNIVIAGDSNLPDIEWNNPRYTIKTPAQWPKALNEKALAIIKECGLQQMVKGPTRGGNTLDTVFTNNENLIESVRVVPGISDHCAVLVGLTV
eukprot:Seg11385.1 transcript_id=Seg11385.1/GoldUCD/mRNA.D3Y31 product="hypothetical protein" protein_id=Seg11385.1/GoldUCD/D3Y31